MVMAERSKYQQKIIKNYYENREAISLQRVQELVTELYLAEGKKRAKLWNSLPAHLEKLGVKPDEIEKVVAQENPELVAKLVQRLMGK
jgi:heme oxygenase